MTFSRKANAGAAAQTGGNEQTSASKEDWNAWNQYQFDCFNAKVKELPNGKKRKEKTLIGKVNFIMDLGYPKAADSEWDTKCALPSDGENYSQEELDWKAKNPTHDFIWTKQYNEAIKGSETVRKQTSPSFPQQEYGVAVDFPQVLIDYSRMPNSKSDTPLLRPYRISLNNTFNRTVQRPITFDGSYKPVSDKNILHKVCVAAGSLKELVDSGYDIGVVAEAVCNFNVRMDLSENGEAIYLNDAVSKPSSIEDLEMPDESVYTAEAQISKVMDKEGIAPFTGILLDMTEFTDTMFSMVGEDKFGYLKRAKTSATFLIEGVSKKTNKEYSFEKGINFDETNFAKELAKRSGEKTEQPKQEVKKEAATVKKEEATPTQEPMEFDEEMDDTIPF